MDGNGRWARSQGLARIRGHSRGMDSIREIVTTCAALDGVEYLTLYAFSRENWKRPKSEVAFLMQLLKKFCRGEVRTMLDNSVRLTTVGTTQNLPDDVQQVLKSTMKATAAGTKLTLCLALDYGARDEIVRAARRIARECAEGRLNARSITEETVAGHLDTATMPDPDLIIRTAGELRLSNFLLWQASYAELYFTPVLWPDFSKQNLHDALRDFARRTRKFGGIEEAR